MGEPTLEEFGRDYFASFQEWVNKASSWIDGKAICFDSKGRLCRMGKDFMRARDEDAFPVYFTWDRLKAFHARELLSARPQTGGRG